MLGVDGRAGPDLTALRGEYIVSSADINPYHGISFGRYWDPNGPHQVNLQATLHKQNFLPNLEEHLVLEYRDGKVAGLDHFLKTGSRYEELTLSVPWLNAYLREHPQETLRLQHVQDSSLGDHAMENFVADMQARGREDLIPTVRSQQSEIALLHIGFVYWLLFPDHHMILWRFEGPSGFLDWSLSDFPAGPCGPRYPSTEAVALAARSHPLAPSSLTCSHVMQSARRHGTAPILPPCCRPVLFSR